MLVGPILGGGAALTNEGDFDVPIAQTLGAAMRNMNQFWGVPFIIEHAVSRDPVALGTRRWWATASCSSTATAIAP